MKQQAAQVESECTQESSWPQSITHAPTHACSRDGKVWEGKTLLVTPSLLPSAFSSMPVCYCMPDSTKPILYRRPLELLNQIMLLMSEVHIAALL